MAVRRRGGRADAKGELSGDRARRLPMAGRRSGKRRFRLLRPRAGRRPPLLRRALPDGLSATERAGEAKPAGAVAKSACEFMATDVRNLAGGCRLEFLARASL